MCNSSEPENKLFLPKCTSHPMHKTVLDEMIVKEIPFPVIVIVSLAAASNFGIVLSAVFVALRPNSELIGMDFKVAFFEGSRFSEATTTLEVD